MPDTPLCFIVVSVLTTKHLAPNNGGAARQESNLQSATNHSANISGHNETLL
jgi:hypothetical protein